MWGERRKRNPRLAALLFALWCEIPISHQIGISHQLCFGGTSGGDPLPVLEPTLVRDKPLVRDSNLAPASRLTGSRLQRTSAGKSACTISTECDDGQSCTSDVCSDGVCVNMAIADCVPCTPSYICPPIDLVFVMDTSGSMRDEAETLCAGMTQVISDLKQQGVNVQADFLGITQTPGGSFSCLTDHVLGLLGGDVPGDAASCPFPDGTSAYESWGPATAIIAQRFNWTPGAMRLVVPISDEGPCDGSLPEGCNDPGDDRDSIDNAIAVALANNVVVSPISGSGSDSCVLGLTEAIANGTGGIALQSKDPKLDLFDAINRIVLDLCEVDDQCVPEICLKATPGSLPDGGCFSVGEDVFVTVELGTSLRAIVGGQFLIKYDPTVLDFIAIHPGAVMDSESPFGLELLRSVNEAEGTIFYAVGVSLGANPTHDPVKMAWIRFRSLQACTTDELCFLSENPANSILVDDQGLRVPFTTCCTGELYINGSGPVLTCPESVSRNALAGRLYADVEWDPILATSVCDGALEVECHGVNEAGIQFESLIPTGGRFPVGDFEFECTATDSCGAASACQWSVDVGGTNTVEVDVQLSAVMTSNLISRCIEFEFYGDCTEPPVVIEQTLDFGGLFNFPGSANNVTLKVPLGNYGCVTARDPRHTLRSVARPEIIDGKYIVEFKGDPMLHGNWLINGNLNGDHVIDLLDHALLLAQYSATLSPNTPCGTGSGLHADLNGNGNVDSGDLGFIQRNFLASDKGACCSTAASVADPSEPSEISLEELDFLGLPHLRAADADDDGMVTAAEILSFLQGGPPAD